MSFCSCNRMSGSPTSSSQAGVNPYLAAATAYPAASPAQQHPTTYGPSYQAAPLTPPFAHQLHQSDVRLQGFQQPVGGMGGAGWEAGQSPAAAGRGWGRGTPRKWPKGWTRQGGGAHPYDRGGTSAETWVRDLESPEGPDLGPSDTEFSFWMGSEVGEEHT